MPNRRGPSIELAGRAFFRATFAAARPRIRQPEEGQEGQEGRERQDALFVSSSTVRCNFGYRSPRRTYCPFSPLK